LILAGGLLGFLTVVEWKPEAAEPVDFPSGGKTLSPGDELTVLTWNLGYAGLGKESEFIFDGGGLYAPSKEQVSDILTASAPQLRKTRPTFVFFRRSTRIRPAPIIST
jgi:hypothetical protein